MKNDFTTTEILVLSYCLDQVKKNGPATINEDFYETLNNKLEEMYEEAANERLSRS